MANLSDLNLDKDVKATGKDFEIIPKGRYKCVILEDERKPNANQTGVVLHLTLQVAEGEFEGCQLLDWLNLKNPNDLTERIGQGTLKTLCHLTGVSYPPTVTQPMWGKPFIARVDIEEKPSKDDPDKMMQSNKIKGYSKWIEKTMNTASKPAEKTEPSKEEKKPW